MNYSDKFQEMLDIAEKNNLYAGSGNPNAKILIIGKELAFNPEKQDQAKYEIDDNIPNWKKNIANHITQQDIPDWKDEYWKELDWKKLNPLYLYKHSTQKEGHTWNKYQKLIEYIRGVSSHKKETDFQEFVFLTEYNQLPSKNSAQQEDKDKQMTSIKKRNEFFKTTPFFQDFPIVIVAAGPYADIHKEPGIDLKETFNVEYKGYIKLQKGNWYALFNASNKLVIHTRQLSMDTTDKLLEEIAKKVKDFAEEKGINFNETSGE